MLPMHITIFCIPSPGKLHATLYLWMDGCYGIDTKSGSIPVNGPNRCRYSSGCWFLACLVRYACLRLLRGRKEGFPPPPPSQEKKPVGNLHFIAFHWVAVEIVVVTPTAGIPFSTSRSWCTWLVGGGDARRMPVRLCWRVCLGWGLGAGRLVRRWRMDWRTFHWRFFGEPPEGRGGDSKDNDENGYDDDGCHCTA